MTPSEPEHPSSEHPSSEHGRHDKSGPSGRSTRPLLVTGFILTLILVLVVLLVVGIVIL